MKKIIITGGLGYIGSLLAEKLIQYNYEVFIFDNFFTNIKSKIKGTKFIKCDITKAFQLNNIKIKNHLFKNCFPNYFFQENKILSFTFSKNNKLGNFFKHILQLVSAILGGFA